MKLQNMAIILIIIILPITLIVSAYTQLQIDTIAVQTIISTKLKDATYDAISAFQLNTNKNDYSTVSDSMRRDVSAAIQAFMQSIAMNWGVGGANEEYIKPYIPAIVFTLYDGYYIYAPSFTYDLDKPEGGVEETYTAKGRTKTVTVTDVYGNTVKDKNGNDKELIVSDHIDTWETKDVIEKISEESGNVTKYENVLKPFIYYTVRYVVEGENTDVIVNYSLDNYIVVYGKIKGTYYTNSGYLVAEKPKTSTNEILINTNEVLTKRLPVTTITYTDKENKSMINDQAIYDVEEKEVQVTDIRLKEVDRLNNSLDADMLSSKLENEVDDNGNGMYTREAGILHIKKYLIDSNPGLNKMYYRNGYKEGDYKLGWYIDPNSKNYYVDPQSANKYYDGDESQEGAIAFTNWVKEHMGHIKASDARKPNGSEYGKSANDIVKFGNDPIFMIDSTNDPEDEGSIFNNHRRDVIRQSIQENLLQAMESYNQHTENYNYKMPILSETEWDQILNNVCMVSFMQGIQAGTKVYNGYTIVTSTKNKEFISPDSIYYINTSGGDGKYHKLGCSHLVDNGTIVGYRNLEFDPMSYETEEFKSDYQQGELSKYEDKTHYYYMHENEACYYCMVNSPTNEDQIDWRKNFERLKAYYTAMAREKYNFYKTNSYIH